MNKIALFLVLSVCLPVCSANAAVVAYRYFGQTLLLTETYDPEETWPATLPAFSGLMLVNESALPGRTLIDATITFSVEAGLDEGGKPVAENPPGLLFFDVFPWPGIGGSTITFTTNAQRDIVSWLADILDGPPDIRSSPAFDTVEAPGSFLYRSAGPGVWTTTVVPLPGAAALSGTAMILLVAAAARRRRASPRPSGA